MTLPTVWYTQINGSSSDFDANELQVETNENVECNKI